MAAGLMAGGVTRTAPQMLAELMDPGTDVLRATEAALSSARTGLRAHADGMMDAARRRLGEERERELAVTHEIGDLRRSQAVRDPRRAVPLLCRLMDIIDVCRLVSTSASRPCMREHLAWTERMHKDRLEICIDRDYHPCATISHVFTSLFPFEGTGA